MFKHYNFSAKITHTHTPPAKLWLPQANFLIEDETDVEQLQKAQFDAGLKSFGQDST